MYSLAHARVNSQAKAFMSAWKAVIPNSFGMFLISDAVDKPLRPMANRFGGCFCLGSGPVLWCFCLFSAVCFAVSAGETQVWLGDLRVVVFGWLLWFFRLCCFNRFAASKDFICPCTNVFPAYSHVRTEPLARHRPHSREKKKRSNG